MNVIENSVDQECGSLLNNRVENSYMQLKVQNTAKVMFVVVGRLQNI
tara:strand:+ start:279 stop:419 length:141 start_codon:yes stop_codon:yes gene_type:complete